MPSKRKPAAKKFKLPREVAIFPLPNVILFPRVELPLYIFEARYRKMLAQALAGNKFIAVSLLQKGWEAEKEPYPIHPIVGVGLLKAVIQNADGTSHILLKGIERARIVKYLQMEPFRVARIRLIPDKVGDRRELREMGRTLRELFIKKLKLASEKPAEEFTLPKELEDPIALSHFVSFTVQTDPYLKQDILETTNANCRVKHLISLLEEEIFPAGTQN